MLFEFRAMDAQGKERKGRIEANDPQTANTKLKEQGLFPTAINEIPEEPETVQKDLKVTKRVPFVINFLFWRITIERI